LARTYRRVLKPIAEADASDAELMANVVAGYHATLKESPEALAYLRSRGLEDAELIEHFKLGFSNRTLAYRLPPSRVKDGAAIRKRLMELGVLRESGHEHMRGSVTFPLLERHGRVVQLYGRRVDNHPPSGASRHLYLPGPHRGVFNGAALGVDSDEVILCESVIDALTFWKAGFRNVTTAYGIEGFTDEIAEALVAANIQVVNIAFDRDEAGDRGAGKVSARLRALGMETKRVLFPRGMDANEYARKVGPAEKSLRIVLERAEWMSREASAPTPSLVASPSSAPASALEELAEESSEAAMTARDPELSERIEPEVMVQTSASEIRAMKAEASEAEASEIEARAMEAPRGSAVPGTNVREENDELIFQWGERSWRVLSWARMDARGGLKVKMIVEQKGQGLGFFIDVFDVHASRQRANFTRAAAADLKLEEAVIARELGEVLRVLEEKRAARVREAMAPRPSPASAMSDEERAEALALLCDPNLLERVTRDLGRAGLVGEDTNKLVAYLAATSRKLEEPLAVVIQSSSAAGKSTLMDTVLHFVPEEDRIQYSAMTGQSLFYMGDRDLKHKVLAIVEEEGAERASYALKLLQSEGELTMAAPGKDPTTGKLITHEYRVEGPVMIMLTTTAIEVDEELLNRCLVLTVDESREQTRAIHKAQRHAETLEGLMERQERPRIRRLHRNAQRLLRPLLVVNAYAEELRFVDHTTRTRRDHMKLLNLIRAVALVHQYQRPIRTTTRDGKEVEYIEATRADVEIALKLGHAVLGRSLEDLPPQTKRLLELIFEMAKRQAMEQGLAANELRFSRREVREETRWSVEQLRVHLGRLVELEYLIVHRGKRGQSFEYELLYEGEGQRQKRFVLGLGQTNGVSTRPHLGVA
jgi:DNA primase